MRSKIPARILPGRGSKSRNIAHLAPGNMEPVRTKATIIPSGEVQAPAGCALTEGGAHLEGKLFQREGLLQEIRFDVDHFVVEHGLSGIARNEEELSIRPHLRKFCRQLPAAHV